MVRKLVVLSAMMFLLSGCFMAPLALIGPASSGFSTASIIQSTVTTSANYMVKKTTGKTITDHALSALNKQTSIILKQTYFPESKKEAIILPLEKPTGWKKYPMKSKNNQISFH